MVHQLLIWDSDASRRPAVECVLATAGCELVWVDNHAAMAESAQDTKPSAIAIVERTSPDVIEAIKTIASDPAWQATPIILICTSDDHVMVKDALLAGASFYFRILAEGLELEASVAALQTYLNSEATRNRKLQNSQKYIRQLKDDLELGQQVQMSFLPANKLETPRFQVEARLEPGGNLSGDYYDYKLVTPERLAVFLADVSGHGIASALLASRLKAYFDENYRRVHRPRLFLERLNRVVIDLGQHHHIATAVSVHIDVSENVLTFGNAGHRTMYWLIKGTDEYTELPVTGPALGMFEEFEIEETTRSFIPGRNRLVIYTDGLLELKLGDDQWLSETSYRDDVILANAGLACKDYAETLLNKSRELIDHKPWDDDVSVMIIDF